MNVIEKLKESNDPILKAQSNDVDKWKLLKHNKTDLELFLEFNIAHLRFKPKSDDKWHEIYCTSNTILIKTLSLLKKSAKTKTVKEHNFSGIHTKDSSSVLTYNIIDEKYNTIDLRSWEIIEFMQITPENVLILDELLCNMLNRKIIND